MHAQNPFLCIVSVVNIFPKASYFYLFFKKESIIIPCTNKITVKATVP